MDASGWLEVPIGINAQHWVTRRDLRTVLAVVHTMTSAERVMEAVELLENDWRLQVVFTQAPDAFGNGVADLLRSTEGVVLSWEQAIRERFDLALAAAYGSLHQLHAPVVVMAHGAGYAKSHRSTTGELRPYGLDSQRLLHNGKPVADLVVLSHDSQLDVLRDQCREALDVAEVIGDLTFDRLTASLPSRAAYSAALGIAPEQSLVVVTSTWGVDSLFGAHLEVIARLLTELPPDRFRVAALCHPAIWYGHGPRQVKAWLADCVDAGLKLFTPELDWRAALVAADHVIGDHGSTTAYAAAIGRPVMLVEPPPWLAIADNSPQARLGQLAGRLRAAEPLVRQLGDDADLASEVAPLVTSRPGKAAAGLRDSCYRLLGLAAPDAHRELTPVRVPREQSVDLSS
ncbi:hypothetical protein ACIA8G_18330 [Lentzea sp. NPDC051213]|uniref:hypothetical protein n=1 Tax=Lentzea sp. NPDC051213 TaxID=3364126 RepID=UPI0037A174AE